MDRYKTTYGGATGRMAGFAQLCGSEARTLDGRLFTPGTSYQADDPVVMRNRQYFRLVSATPVAEPEVRERPDQLADPDED